jgi:hypothetical protein
MRTRRQNARDKELRGQRIEYRMWKRWRRERLEALLQGPFAESTSAFLEFCKTMTGAGALVDFVKAGPWPGADADIRFEILSLLDAVIIKQREKLGLMPFDDAVGGMPINAFLLVREQLNPPDGGAARGEARFDQQNTVKQDSKSCQTI